MTKVSEVNLVRGLEMKIEALAEVNDELTLALHAIIMHATGGKIIGTVSVDDICKAIDLHVESQKDAAVKAYADFVFVEGNA